MKLTKNQQAVFDALKTSDTAKTAYELLDDLRDQGLRAPPQIYRALEKLGELGLVHRLESMNAFVACGQHDCSGHQSVAFAICDDCGKVEEISGKEIEQELSAISQKTGFHLSKSVLELHGHCGTCPCHH